MYIYRVPVLIGNKVLVAGCLSLSTSATMTDNKRLAFSIIQFLHDQLQSGTLSSDAQESLEGESSDMKKKNMKLLSSFLSWLRMHS